MGEIEKKLNTNTSINKNIDKHIILKFLGTAVMGILESYVLNEIDSDVECCCDASWGVDEEEYITVMKKRTQIVECAFYHLIY